MKRLDNKVAIVIARIVHNHRRAFREGAERVVHEITGKGGRAISGLSRCRRLVSTGFTDTAFTATRRSRGPGGCRSRKLDVRENFDPALCPISDRFHPRSPGIRPVTLASKECF
jgi:hypothetical protein